MFAKAIYLVGKNAAYLLDHSGFSPELVKHLGSEGVLDLNGDTHLARFIESGYQYESGDLTNTMPGSSFERYEFAQGTLLKTTLVVAIYE